MRAFVVYFGVIGLMIWMASDGHLDRISSRFSASSLPIGVSTAPAAGLIDLTDTLELDDLAIVPAANAGGVVQARVTGAVVNLRAGPGLSYRMVDVAERGQSLWIDGEWVDGWAPVYIAQSGLSAWVHGNYISRID